MQKYTSKNTSVNTTNLPAVYNKVCWDKLPRGTIVFDWGCGKDTKLISKTLLKYGLMFVGYDPNWISEERNKIALESLDITDVFVCSNVLNVIDDDDVVRSICETALKHEYFFITVYEGDKSGIGKQSKEDCYQRNEKIKSYVKFFHTDKDVYVKKSVITNRPDLIK